MNEMYVADKQQEVVENKKPTPQWDRNKRYSWKADQNIVISGLDFNVIYNFMTNEMNKPETQRIIEMINASRRLEAIFEKEVLSGNFVPAEETKGPVS